MKKWMAVIALLAAAGIFFWYWQSSTSETVDQVRMINPTGPTVLSVAGLDSGEIAADFSIDVHYWRNIDEAAALLAADQADFAVLPVTAGANLHGRGIDLVLLGVHQWRAFYLIAREGLPFQEWSDLKDQTVYSAVGRGTTSDIIMRSSLNAQGINPEQEVTFLYAPPQEIVTLFQAGRVDYAALPEPFVTLSIGGNTDLIVLDFQEYWGQAYDTEPRIPITGLFVKREFYQAYPEQVEEVIQLFAASTSFAREEEDRALEIANEILPIPGPVMKNALSRMDFYFVPIRECRDEVDFFLRTIYEMYPEALVAVPGEGFYSP